MTGMTPGRNEPPETVDGKTVARLRIALRGRGEKAERELAQLGDQQVDALLEVLKKESSKKMKMRRIALAVFIILMVVMVLNLALGPHSGMNPGMFTGWITAVVAASAAQKNAAKRLAEHDDIRAVGPLVDALGYNDKGVQDACSARLVRLLPRLLESDYDLLGKEQRGILRTRLAAVRKPDVELQVAILRGLQQVGDESFVAPVEKLAANPKAKATVRLAAQECLEFLRPRVEKQRQAAMLLRPAGVNEVQADLLLRPADAPPNVPPEQLLQPAAAPTPAYEETEAAANRLTT